MLPPCGRFDRRRLPPAIRGDNTLRAAIAGFDAELTRVAVGGDAIALWRVAALEHYVDRAALLAGDDPAEPPYWADLWSGALVLAEAVPPDAGRVVELGCGLAVPGLVAARRGGRVTLLDRIPAALAFAQASARANGLVVDAVAADALGPALRARFDLVLAAELLYDRPALPALAAAIVNHLSPGGRALVSDAGRTDTAAFYAALDVLPVRWSAREQIVREERLPVRVRVVEIAPR